LADGSKKGITQRQFWRERLENMGNGNIWKTLTSILGVLVVALGTWVWNMERRVTILEVQRANTAEDIQEIKVNVKEILVELRSP
jgi:hypothetical protein